MSELLKCPFCGGEAEIGNPYPRIFLIWCRNCHIGTTNCPSRKRAVELWNRRTPMANIVEKLEEVKDRFSVADFAIRGIVQKAIEIVRKGGVE